MCKEGGAAMRILHPIHYPSISRWMLLEVPLTLDAESLALTSIPLTTGNISVV